MFKPDPNTTAEYALMIADTFNIFAKNKNNLTPDFNGDSFLKKNWEIEGYLIANDSPLELSEEDKHINFYGYLLHKKNNPLEKVAVVRGTGTTLEWIDNCKSLPKNHPAQCGVVEDGFFDIYKTMKFVGLDKNINNAKNAGDAIAQIVVATKSNVTVLGHSLGGALASYLTYDIAKKNPNQTSMCAFASPKPGDSKFAENFENTVKNYVVFNYTKDIVPDLPPSFLGFKSLKNVSLITPESSQAVIKDEVFPNHHVVCYAAMLNYNYTNDWKSLLIQNNDEPDCVLSAHQPEVSSKSSNFVTDVVNKIKTIRNTIEEKMSNKPKM